MPEPGQPVTDGTSGMMYKRVGAWIAHRAETNPQSLFFYGTEADETVRICCWESGNRIINGKLGPQKTVFSG
ncbi:hypothetical protein QBC45DRAFT_423807 [Copromyces sp. CBS 386.78]|nr:hypothetical protein QBC45DRAFT_423807 [Copromyces sp. CBS 386.78]